VPPAFSDGTRGSGETTAMGECAGVIGVSIAATETLDPGNVPPSTSGEESGIQEKSECKMQAATMCGAIVTTGDDKVELPTTEAVDTSDATVVVLRAAAADTEEVRCNISRCGSRDVAPYHHDRDDVTASMRRPFDASRLTPRAAHRS